MTLDDIAQWLAAAPAAQGVLGLDETRTYLLGPRTQLETEPAMLDWRTAPLAEAFFRSAPGEPYELEVGDRVVEGRVRERWVIANHGDALISDDRVIARDGEHPAVRPAPVQVPPTNRSILPVLDPEQQAAVDLPADTSLVIDGEAGVGKTLVALFRVAALAERAREKSRRFRALVLVPTEGLRRLVRILAERLSIGRLEIAVIDDWLLERARAAFSGLPKRTSEDAAAQVIALKRHPAVRVALGDFVGWRPPKTDDKLSRPRVRLLHLFGDQDRLVRVVAAAGGALPERAIAQTMLHTRRQFETTTEKANAHVDADRLVALDGRRLDAGTPMQNANTFDAEDVPVLFELARRGALRAAEQPHYDHIVVDEGQLRAPMELAAIGDALAPHATVTLAGDHRQASDETAWFAGWTAARGELRRSRWAETTLAVTYRSVPAISTFARGIVERATPAATDIVGAEERAAPGVGAPGIAAPGVAGPGIAAPGTAAPGVAGLGVAGPGVAGPGVGGPGTAAPDIAGPDIAGPGVVGPDVATPGVAASDRAAPGLPPEPPLDPAVWASRCPGALAQAAAMCWHLDALLTRDPWREICVVARTAEHARRLHAELARGLDPLLVLDGDFRFAPGIVVTTAAAVSGLEFDAVVIPDLTPAFYPPGSELARSLYVAATRARDWLWLLTPESWSPLVAPC